MANQLNPAWRHRLSSFDHPANISSRFLSDGTPPECSPDDCQVIPFLLDNPGQDWVTQNLCEVLTRRGHPCLLYHSQEDNSLTSPAELETALREQAADNEICLFPTTSTTTIQYCHFSHLVLLVPANLDAVLTAYQRIKLLSRRHAPDIGIVMVGPRDQHAAWRYFRKLAVGSLRYLDIPLLNLGFLPQQVLPEQGPANRHRQNFLTRISERLLRSGFHSSNRTKAPAKTPAQA